MLPLVLLAALVFLAIWVDYGVFRGLDRYAYRHLQPLRRTDWTALTLPAEIPFAALILLLAVLKLREAGRRREAAVWVLAFAAALVIELVGKATVARPYVTGSRILGTSVAQGTFPSGHTMRTIVVAGALCAAWPRYRFWFVGLAVLIVAAVELTGMHSPSEVIGGLLGGLGLVAAAHATRRRGSSGSAADRGRPAGGARRFT